MKTQKTPPHQLEEFKMSVKMKLAAMWSSFMFLYIYVDHFHLYMPGTLEDILKERVFEFDITHGFLLVALVSVTIPALMIFLSAVLPAKVNRRMNMSIALVYIPYTLFNLVGEVWIHMVVAAAVEVTLLCLIIRTACKWPRIEIG